jgi:hypothetical protein
MTRAALLAEWRKTVGDVSIPYKWDDDMVLSAMQEGQDVFCEETGFFVDFTNFTQVLDPGTTKYALDSRIIKVLEVWNLTSGEVRLSPFTERERPVSISTPLVSCDPYMWQTDRETGYLTLYPSPATAITLTIRAQRYSLYSLTHQTAGAYDKEPEIPDQCRRCLVNYAAALWFGWRDRDEENNPEAIKNMNKFNFYVTRGRRMFENLRSQYPEVAGNSIYLFQ